jgi:diaminopimelate decarboxylase
MHRRLHFPTGVAVGDIIAFPNTAGYLMHFIESRSHQFDLPINVVMDQDRPFVDPIDERGSSPSLTN